MRIAVLNMTAGGISGGYKKYLINTIPYMSESPDVEMILCAAPKLLQMGDWFEPLENVQLIDSLPFRLWRTFDLELSRRLFKFSPDVIFIPMERYYKYLNVPVVNMLTNMLPMVSIENNLVIEKFRNYVQKLVTKYSVMKADRTIAVSTFVHEYLSREWSIPVSKIGFVYHGVGSMNRERMSQPSIIPVEWGNRFLFTAGSIDPYRGLEDLLQSMVLLKSQGLEIRVVIAGTSRPLMKYFHNLLKKYANDLNIASNICWVGYLSENEMSWCYKNCTAFVMSSRVEACPNIALEALSHGCLSVFANNPPLPEFFGNTGITYTPSNAGSLADAIRIVESVDLEKRRILSMQAMERASGFSWKKTVDKTLLELKKAINREY